MIEGVAEGRIVHFVPEIALSGMRDGKALTGRRPGRHIPAIITRVWPNGSVNLTVFPDWAGDRDEYPGAGGSGMSWETTVSYDPDKGPRTWHWPERA